MAPPHGMGAHEGEAIGIRECVHIGEWHAVGAAAGRPPCVSVCVAGCMIYVCACSMWQSQRGHQGAGSCIWAFDCTS
jgi:hypothetical protein